MKKVNKSNWTSVIHPIPKVFLDVGVGVQNSEAWQAKKAWKDVRIIGFESDAQRYKKLKGFPGKLMNCAVGTKDEIEIDMCRIDGMSHMFPRPKQKDKGTRVVVTQRSLDSIENEFGPFENVFIWADIEGAELEMLRGSVGLLESDKVVGLNLELWKHLQVENWCVDTEVKEFLSRYGFIHTHDWPGPKINHYDAIFLRS